MKDLLNIYRAQFKMAFALQIQYRAMLVIWAVSNIVEPVLYIAVWRTVAAAQGGQVGDYAAGDFAAYFLVVLIVGHLTYSWIMWEYEFRIREGLLSAALLRPIHPIHADIAENIAYKVIALVLLLPAMGILAFVFKATFNTQLWAVLAFIPALVLAFLLRFLMEWTIAQAAFWTTRMGAINQVYFVVLLFLSGRLSPLSLLPQPVQTLAAVLPFRWMLAFPVELLLGHLTPTDALIGYTVQLVWIGITVLGLRVVWRRGIQAYTAVGA